MPILIVEHNGTVEGASLSGRVLIGRRASNHVVIGHPDVSRIHAWIDTAGRQFWLTDAGSRTGTFINGSRVTGKVALHHGDRIAVGPAGLTFRTDASLPAGLSELAFGTRGVQQDGDRGVLLDCACGAPLWAAAEYAGRTGACRSCGAIVQIPSGTEAIRVDGGGDPPPHATIAIAPGTPAVQAVTQRQTAATEACGACQSLISPGETTTACPACGLTFHDECWAENYGCSAYGCSQVNVLLPRSHPSETAGTFRSTERSDADGVNNTGGVAGEHAAGDPDPASPPNERVPREYLLLAASVAGLLAGTLTFGAPALMSLLAVVVYWRRHPAMRHPGVAGAAALLALAGAAAGVVISYVWWLGGWSGPS